MAVFVEKSMHSKGVMMSIRNVIDFDPDRLPRFWRADIVIAGVVRHECLWCLTLAVVVGAQPLVVKYVDGCSWEREDSDEHVVQVEQMLEEEEQEEEEKKKKKKGEDEDQIGICGEDLLFEGAPCLFQSPPWL